MLEVFTIGHSTRTWKVFLELLRVHGIKRVIDVRSIPRSRHNPRFNRETLSAKLRPAQRATRFAEHGLAQCVVSRVRRLYANTGFRGGVRALNLVSEAEKERVN